MPVNPVVGYSAGDISGLVSRYADLERRLRNLEATRAYIGVNAVGGDNIGPGSITGTHITPGSITTGSIVAGSIDASVINAGSIGAAVGAFISINANQIVAGSIAATQMQANVVQAIQASITQLSAITSNVGSITAGTISGATIQTPDGRLILDSQGIRGYKPGGNIPANKVFELNTGTGLLTATGVIYADASSVIPGSTIPAGTLPGEAIFPASVTTLQLAAGAVTANNIAAGAIQAQHITVAFDSPNVVVNPSFENNAVPANTSYAAGSTAIPGWSVSSGFAQRATAQQYIGNNALLMIPPVAGGGVTVYSDPTYPVTAGQAYTLSAYGMNTVGSRTLQVGLYWLDASGNAVGSPSFITSTGVQPSTWTRMSIAGVAPAGAASAYIGLFANGTSALDRSYFDAIQLERGSSASVWQPNPNEILPGSVGNTQIAPDAITTDKILAGTIQAGDMTVSQLSAISANVGAITSGTLTAATVRSAATTQRAQLDSAGFRYFGTDGSTLFSAIGGTVTMKGSLTATDINFINVVDYVPGNISAAIRWFTGNAAAEVGYLMCGSTTGITVVEAVARTTTSGISEWRMKANNGINSETIGWLVQHSSSAVDFARLYYTAPGGTTGSRTLLEIHEDGDLFAWYAPTGGGDAGKFWMSASTYMHVREDWGWRFSGGGYTTMNYGGSGTTHILYANSGDSTNGANNFLGYSIALGHVDTSDERKKFDIRSVDDFAALSKIRALRPIKYAWRGGSTVPKSELGFSAQEIKEIIPEAVIEMFDTEGEITSHALRPTAVIAQLVMAVQELAETVNILRGEAPDAPLRRDLVTAIQ